MPASAISESATPAGSRQLTVVSRSLPSAFFLDAGEDAWRRVLEFFTAHIRNRNTRAAYVQAISQFARWCQKRHVPLRQITPIIVAAYIEEMTTCRAAPTTKQHLAAIRMLCDFLVVGQVLPTNPASSVRGPKHVVKKGLTPVLTPDEARCLLSSIDVTTIVGLRDRAILGVMVYSFARVGAVVAMNVEDYFAQGKRGWVRLHEKGGKLHDVPAHHTLEEYLDAYVAAADLAHQQATPLFRTINRAGEVTERRLHRLNVLQMIKRRAPLAGLSPAICCHTFRATGITAYLLNGGALEHAQRIAAHESPRTTKLYDRTSDEISLDEIERIML